MSDYGWFAIKNIFGFALIAFAVYLTNSAWCLWALLLMPSWPSNESDTDKK